MHDSLLCTIYPYGGSRIPVVKNAMTLEDKKQPGCKHSELSSTTSQLTAVEQNKEIDISMPFKVKPLNKHNIPRERWQSDTPPRRQIRGMSDLDEKMLERLKRSPVEAGRVKKAKYETRFIEIAPAKTVTIRKQKANPAREAKKVQKKTLCDNSYLGRIEPQVGLGDIFGSVGRDGFLSHRIGVDTNMSRIAHELQNTVQNLTDVVKEAKLTVEVEASQSVTDTLVSLKDFMLFAVIIAVICILKPETRTERMLVYMMIVSLLATKLNLMQLLRSSGVLDWFQKPLKPAPEFGVPRVGDDLAVMITSLINLYVCGSMGKEIFSPNEFLRVSSHLSRSTPTVANIVRGVGLIVEYITTGIEQFFKGRSDGLYGIDFIDTFVKEYNEIVELYENKELHARQTSVDRVKNAIELGEYTWARVPTTPDFVTIRVTIQNALSGLRKIRTALKSTNFLYNGIRQEPVTLLLRGKPGVGKSQSMQHFGHSLCARTLNERDYERFLEDPNSFTFPLQAENVYMDGYTQEKRVVFVDDILQARDIQGNPDNEAMKIIRAVNIFENQLHMSDIKDKGVTSFRAPFIIANTNNLGVVDLQSIHDKGAFMRRWDVVVDVVPKVEYCVPEGIDNPYTRRFDYSKFPKFMLEEVGNNLELLQVSKHHPTMCEYLLMTLDHSDNKFVPAMSSPLEFDQVVDALVEIYARKKHYHEGYLITLDQTLKMQREIWEKENFKTDDFKDFFEEGKKEGPESVSVETFFDASGYFDNEKASIQVDRGRSLMGDNLDSVWGLATAMADMSLGTEVIDPKYTRAKYSNAVSRVDFIFPSPIKCGKEIEKWSRRSQRLEMLVEQDSMAFSWIVQMCENIMLENDVEENEWDAFSETIMSLSESFVDEKLDLTFCDYSIGDSSYFFIGSPDFWKEWYRYVYNRVGNHGWEVDHEKFLELPFCFGSEGKMYWLQHDGEDCRYMAHVHCTDEIGTLCDELNGKCENYPEPGFDYTEEREFLCKSYGLNTDADYIDLYKAWSQACEEAKKMEIEDVEFLDTDDKFVRRRTLELLEKPSPQAGFFDTFFKPKARAKGFGYMSIETAIQIQSGHTQYVLTKGNQFILEIYKTEDVARWTALHYGVITVVSRAYIERNLSVNPDDVFELLHEYVVTDDFESFCVMENGRVDIDEVCNRADLSGIVPPRQESSLQRISSAVTISLGDLREKTVAAGGTMYRFYRYCLQFLGAIFTETVHEGIKKISNSPRNYMYFATIVGGMAGVTMAFNVVKNTLAVIFGNGDVWPHSDERSNRSNRTRVRRNPRPKISPHALNHTNQNLVSVMDMVANNNMYEVWTPEEKDFRLDGRTHNKAGFAIGLKGTTVLMPWHFYSVVGSCLEAGTISPDDTIIFKHIVNKTRVCVISAREFINGFVPNDEGERRDLCLIKLPRHFQPCRDILNHFATDKQLDHYTKVKGVLFIPNEKTNDRIHVVAVQQNDIIVGGGDVDDFSVADVFAYDADTNTGDCGSPFYVNDKQKSSLISGVHIAGITGRGRGYSARVSREFLEDYLHLAGEDYIFEETLNLDLEPTDPEGGTTQVLGKAGIQCKVPGRQMKSAIMRSVIHGKVYPTYQKPALLGSVHIDGVKIDVMDISKKGYSPEDCFIPPEDLDEAFDALEDNLKRVSTSDVEKKLMSFEEAVLGDGPGSEFKGVPRNTSAGYPYNTMQGLKNKARFFGEGVDYDLSSPECLKLREDVFKYIKKAKQGIRVTHVFTDSLKDERRPIEKVNAGKTRMFSASPTPLLIMKRMYFGAFVKWITANRVENGVAIGVNPYGSEWDHIARKLNRFGDIVNKGAGDFSGLDKNELSRVMWMLCDLAQRWYNDSEENQRARKIIYYESVNSLHVNGGKFVFWGGSMPSGDFLTACFNSLYVLLLFILVWMRIMKKYGLSAHSFFTFVYIIVLGDDNAFCVHPKIAHLFTEVLISHEMKFLGQVYTPEDKGSDFQLTLRPLDQISFLKRQWRKHEISQKYVGPLELRVILDMLNWVKKGGNTLGDTEANIDIALCELSLHPRDVFEKWSSKILEVVENEPELSWPKVTKYAPLFREVITRDGSVIDFACFSADYGVLGGKSTGIQIQCGRFTEERACLFRLTARMARGQTLQYPGTSGCVFGCPRPEIQMNRGAVNDEGSGAFMNQTRVDEGAVSEVQQGITHAVNDGGVVKSTPLYTPINMELLDAAETGASNEIRDFLRRPKLVQSGSLSTTDISNVPLWSITLPQGLFGTGDIWTDKIKGNLAFRGELHLTIQINANRFQQGRYMLVFVPTGGGVNSDWFVKTHTATLVETTQCPNVQFDVNCDTEAVIVIPHINVQNWSVVGISSSIFGNIGVARLVPYRALLAPSGSTSCGYSIYAHYEKVEFALPIVPQSGTRVRTRVKRRPNVSPVDSEMSSAGIGPFESIALAVGQIGRSASGIPLLSSIAAPVSWASDIAAKAAHAFGWSKPRIQSVGSFVSRQILHKMSNVDSVDMSVKLALTDKNILEDLPGFAGSNIDEMSLNYIASIPAFWNSYEWITSQAPGTAIMGTAVSPRDYLFAGTQAGVTVAHLTPLAFVSRMFAQWRGSIVFKFKIVKTEFHSGRLMVVFSPYDANGTPPPPSATLSNSTYLHRQIIDIRQGNEFSMTIPYQALQQYRPTTGSNRSIGNLQLLVLNGLVAPATVSSSVTIIVEVHGGGDFEWAVPAPLNGNATAQIVPQMNRGNACDIVDGTIGGAVDNERDIASRTCIGEKILSIRQLLKRFNPLMKNWGTGTTTAGGMWFNPWMIHINQLNSVPAVKYSEFSSDLFDEIAPCYALFRGAMRIKMVTFQDDKAVWRVSSVARIRNTTYSWATDWNEYSGGAPPGVLSDNAPGRMYAFFQSQLTGGVEVEFPYYAEYPSLPVCDLAACNAGVTPTMAMGSTAIIPATFGSVTRMGTAVDTITRPIPYRAIGEDASLGCFVSTVPLLGYNFDLL